MLLSFVVSHFSKLLMEADKILGVVIVFFIMIKWDLDDVKQRGIPYRCLYLFICELPNLSIPINRLSIIYSALHSCMVTKHTEIIYSPQLLAYRWKIKKYLWILVLLLLPIFIFSYFHIWFFRYAIPVENRNSCFLNKKSACGFRIGHWLAICFVFILYLIFLYSEYACLVGVSC